MIRSKEAHTEMDQPYEQWQLTLPSLPPPSTLYALSPLGIETASVESLTSYIGRLALAHCVFPGMLMHKVIAPFAENVRIGSSASLQLGDARSARALNSATQAAMDTVGTLESLTMQSQLCSLTMITWRQVLPLLGLIGPTRAWCPDCLMQWHAAAQTVYEPLLWAVQAVKVCNWHHRRLETHCPGCKRTAPWLKWHSRPGYCPHCHHWLGISQATAAIDETEMTWLHWCTDQIGALLAIAPTLTTLPLRASVSGSLVTVLEQISQGRKRSLARLAGLSKKMVTDWFSRQQLPSLQNLLRVCFAVNISLPDFLLGKPLVCTLRVPATQRRSNQNPHQNARGFWKSDQVRRTLEAIARGEQTPPPSLKAVARQLGSPTNRLKTYHPVSSQIISERYVAYRKAKKLATEQQHRQELQDAIRQLTEQNRPLVEKNVAPLLSKPGLLRSPVIREALRLAIVENEGLNRANR